MHRHTNQTMFLFRLAYAIPMALFLLAAVTLSASTNNYYVASNGSNFNDGSEAHPWATIQHAVDHFVLGSSGSIIHVAAGRYSAPDIRRGGSSQTVRLVLQCDPGQTSATAAIGQCRISNTSIVVEANNVDIIGFDVGSNANMGTGIQGACSPTGPVACTTANSMHVIGNYVHDIAQNVVGDAGIVGCPSAGAIMIGSNQHGHTATDPQAVRNFIRNYGRNPSSAACHTAHGIYSGATPAGSITVVENNVIASVPVSGYTNSNAKCNLIVSNNTIISAAAGIILSGGDTRDCPGGNVGRITVANNAFFNVSLASVYNVGGAPDCSALAPTLYSHNISDGRAPDFNSSRLSCDTVSPKPFIHVSGGSFFVNYQTNGWGNYHLTPGSAGIDRGSTKCTASISVCVPAKDFDGIARPEGSAYDVGAHEF